MRGPRERSRSREAPPCEQRPYPSTQCWIRLSRGVSQGGRGRLPGGSGTEMMSCSPVVMAGQFKVSACLRLSPRECLTQVLFQGVMADVKMDAGDIPVALSHSHFRVVMSEIRGHLKALAEISMEFVFSPLLA